MSKRIVIIGAGGFAREVRWLLEDITASVSDEDYAFLGYVVSDLQSLGPHDSADDVLGDYSWLAAHGDEVDGLAMGIGSPAAKLKVAAELDAVVPGMDWPVLIHPTVQLQRASCTFGRGVVLCAGVIGTVQLQFHDFAMVNLACTIGHEAVLGAGCVLNPTVNISGGVELERGVLVGTGAQILQYVKVGRHATVGAGACVTKHVEPETVVVGMPAKPLGR